MSGIVLETKLVSDIKGAFCVPEYQRGYRWGENEVVRLLDDIHEAKGNYCLQPVVVRKDGRTYELIDGQQRLTTIYLLEKYLHEKVSIFEEPDFTLEYETRPKTKEYLDSLDEGQKEANIDFWFLWNAYASIKRWFEETQGSKSTVYTDINAKLHESVKVIWYEVASNEDSISLFTRLNIGKIPLTNAELVKAMFLSRNSQGLKDDHKQLEIAMDWDEMERGLGNESFWCFLTNEAVGERYQTRIDLVLDLIAGNDGTSRDEYATFFAFQKMRANESMEAVWDRIKATYLLLNDWYEDHDLYHYIGYIVATGYRSLGEIYEMSLDKNKDDFRRELIKIIKESVKLNDRNYGDLSYENEADKAKISRLLLLFNVESVRLVDAKSQRFPFDTFKAGGRGKAKWSLEHIHAQHSEGLNKDAAKLEWLKLQAQSLRSINQDSVLAEEAEELLEKPKDLGSKFEGLRERIEKALSASGGLEYLHTISNLALLKTDDNAALSNSTFDVKRNAIIEMDKEGKFIPFCTKMVFFKYYTPSENNQIHFWGIDDRKAYVDAMNKCLKPYLDEAIAYGEERGS